MYIQPTLVIRDQLVSNRGVCQKITSTPPSLTLFLYIVVSVDKDGKWHGRRLVDEQTPARPAWRKFMESQHPASETNGLIKRNRVFGLIAVGGGMKQLFSY
jgi:hypothetical protein